MERMGENAEDQSVQEASWMGEGGVLLGTQPEPIAQTHGEAGWVLKPSSPCESALPPAHPETWLLTRIHPSYFLSSNCSPNCLALLGSLAGTSHSACPNGTPNGP